MGTLGGAIGASIASATTKMHAITKMGNAIAVLPFTTREVFYNEAIKIESRNIKSAKVTGLLTGN